MKSLSEDRFRVTIRKEDGSRTTTWMTKEQLQKFRAKKLKEIRSKELGLTQKQFANAVGANLRTLQDWEMGRSPMPKPVELLLELMKEIPAVKKRLLKVSLT